MRYAGFCRALCTLRYKDCFFVRLSLSVMRLSCVQTEGFIAECIYTTYNVLSFLISVVNYGQ